MTRFIRVVLLSLTAVLGIAAFTAPAAEPPRRPNVLLIVSDDQGTPTAAASAARGSSLPTSTGWRRAGCG